MYKAAETERKVNFSLNPSAAFFCKFKQIMNDSPSDDKVLHRIEWEEIEFKVKVNNITDAFKMGLISFEEAIKLLKNISEEVLER